MPWPIASTIGSRPQHRVAAGEDAGDIGREGLAIGDNAPAWAGGQAVASMP